MGRWQAGSDELWVDGYVRVSQVGKRHGERFISPRTQREAIEGWASRRGARLLTVFEDLDASGGRFDRVKLERAIGRIEAGISKGIVVDSVDRFGRSQALGMLTVQRIQDAGGAVFAVHEGLDSTTDAGRFVLRNMLSAAEWGLERRRAAWELARRDAIARGVHIASRTPVGYRKLPSGRLRPDPRTAPWITELFKRRAGGATLSQLACWLASNDIRTTMGNRAWTPMTVGKVLSNRVYLGEVHSRPYVRADAHPPLTDASTWELAQRPRQPQAPCRRGPALLLTGVVRCAGCGRPMWADSGRESGQDFAGSYCCHLLKASTPCECPAPAAIRARLIEPLVEAAALRVLENRRSRPNAELRLTRDAVVRAERELIAYRDSTRSLAVLGPDAFADGLQVRAHRLRRARLDQAMVEARCAVRELPPAGEVKRNWDRMTVEARREVIRAAIDCAFVTRGRAPAPERVTIFPVGTGPRELPSRRGQRRTATPYLQSSISMGSQPCEIDPAVLRARLRQATRGRSTWPSADEFRRRGHSTLYAQAVWQGGERFWAARLGLTFKRKVQRSGPWNEQRVRACLRLFLDDRDTWPTTTEFHAAGLQQLCTAIPRHGGTTRWAREFAVTIDRHGKGHWTPDTIRATLTEFCAGCTHFPTADEFKDAKLSGLYSTLVAEHSLKRWRDELGLPLGRSGRRAKTNTPSVPAQGTGQRLEEPGQEAARIRRLFLRQIAS